MDADVLVVGAGPTGLMLANQLGRRGVRTRVIDRHPGPSLQTRALGVQARTLEIYAHLGIVERALELGRRATGANIWAEGRRAARLPLGDIGRDLSPYPFLLILGQDDNERLLGDALRNRGMAVQWNTGLVGLTQEADRVRAMLRRPDGSSGEITAAWVAGCDGAHSAVREFNGIAFQGAPYEHVFFVARYPGDGTDGAGRAQRLPVARRIPSVLPHARDRSLAAGGHPAAGLAGKRRSEVRGRDSLGAIAAVLRIEWKENSGRLSSAIAPTAAGRAICCGSSLVRG